MAKPKAQTLQQRFGFADQDLKTPKHDEMMLWLDQNYLRIVKELSWVNEWTETDVFDKPADLQKAIIELNEKVKTLKEVLNSENVRSWHKDDLRKAEQKLFIYQNLGELPPKPDLESSIIDVVMEEPIVSASYNSKYIIGFADLSLSYKRWCLRVGENGWSVIDVNQTRNIYFEAKTKIPSMGELVRQIQMYRQYTHGEWVIVSPDDRFVEPLEKQGIHFYKYPY